MGAILLRVDERYRFRAPGEMTSEGATGGGTADSYSGEWVGFTACWLRGHAPAGLSAERTRGALIPSERRLLELGDHLRHLGGLVARLE